MKKFALVCGILVSVVSLAMGEMSNEERFRAQEKCWERDKSACEALINNGLPSVEQCDKDTCGFAGAVYYNAKRYKEAIPYYEKAIALGDNDVYALLGLTYYLLLQDYHNAKKYAEIGCNKGIAENCHILGRLYYDGQGVQQDYHKAFELFKKACDMGEQVGCDNYKLLNKQQGVR